MNIVFKRAAASALTLVIAGGSAYAADANRCLYTQDIRSTRILDDNTILFEMNGGKTYQNKLRNRCSGLYVQNGFAYDSSPNAQLCGDRDVIYVLRQGTPCFLGSFSPYEKPAKG